MKKILPLFIVAAALVHLAPLHAQLSGSSLNIGSGNSLDINGYSGVIGSNNVTYGNSGGRSSLQIGNSNTLEDAVGALSVGESNYGYWTIDSEILGMNNNAYSCFTSVVIGSSNTVWQASDSLVVGTYNYVTANYGVQTIVAGQNNDITAYYSNIFAFGTGLAASYPYTGLALFGSYNDGNTTNNGSIFVIGNGSDSSNRRDAFDVFQNGDINIPGGKLSIFATPSSTSGIVLDPAAGQITINGQPVLTSNASGFVGIGTGAATPFTNLQVQGATAGKPQVLVNSTSSSVSPAIELKDNAATPNRWWLASGSSNATDGKFVIKDARQGQSRLAIDASGNVGIGTTTPSQLLHISKANQAAMIIESTAAAATDTRLIFKSPDHSWQIGQDIGTFATGKFNIYDLNAGATRFVIDADGNAGLGTTTPHFGLDMYSGHVVFKNGTSQTDQGGDAKNMGLGWASNNDSKSISNLITVDRNGNYGGDFKFYSRNTYGGTMPSALMTLTAYGNLGIGTTSPQGKLTVVGLGTNGAAGVLSSNNWDNYQAISTDESQVYSGATINFLSNIAGVSKRWDMVLGAGSNTRVGSGNFGIYDFTNGAARLVISSSGNVGIGTIIPAAKLDVNGDAKFAGALNLFASNYNIATPNSGKIVIQPSISGSSITIDGQPLVTAISTAAQSFTAPSYSFNSGSTNRLIINSSGNVGIGTSSASSLLTVGGPIAGGAGVNNASVIPATASYILGNDTNSGSFYVGNTNTIASTANLGFVITQTGGEQRIGARIYSSWANSNNQQARLDFHVKSGGNDNNPVMSLLYNGNVGIGTTSPNSKLNVKGVLSVFNSSQNTVGNAADGDIVLPYGGFLRSANDVNNDTTGLISLGNYGGVGNSLLIGNASNAAWPASIQFRTSTWPTSSTERMRIDTNGNVGIGTTTPAAKLDVNGNAAVGTGLTGVAAGQVVVGKYNDTRTSDTSTTPAATNHTQGVFIVAAGTSTTGANAIRVLDDGTVLVKNSGDIGMGSFTNGPRP